MAEQEIRKNFKKVVTITKDKKKGIWHKLEEIAIEIAIVVFAVSVTIWFHSWSEHRHQQKEVKEFLIGLNKDLDKDIEEMKQDMNAYVLQQKLFSYLSSIPENKGANIDSIQQYKSCLFNFILFGKNSGRYQGFKSSGKLAYIENEELMNMILDLYEENIPLLQISTDFYKNEKLKFIDDVEANTNGFPNGNFLHVLSTSPVQNKSKIYLAPNVSQILHLYESCIEKMMDIKKEINIKK